MQPKFIPVAAPTLAGNEKKYVNDCLDSTWISSTGQYIDRFEAAFADYCGVKHAVACSNGTTALHLALLGLGVGPGDEVIIPTLTFVATANAVTYCGGKPVLVDSEPGTWNIDPAQIECRITPRTKGIVVVHLFGHPADMTPIIDIARRHGLFVLEDAAQAHGAEYSGRRTGALGDAATFSFFGNKIISTGEGGMFVTNDDAMASHVRQLRSHGMDPKRRYWFPMVGYNYRMTNICAAIGLAQLENIDFQLRRRREVVSWYLEEFASVPGVFWQAEHAPARHAWWMFTAVLADSLAVDRDGIMLALRDHGIETRPVVIPMHQLPPYRHLAFGSSLPVSDRLARRGINLPTWAGISREDVSFICEKFLACVHAGQPV